METYLNGTVELSEALSSFLSNSWTLRELGTEEIRSMPQAGEVESFKPPCKDVEEVRVQLLGTGRFTDFKSGMLRVLILNGVHLLRFLARASQEALLSSVTVRGALKASNPPGSRGKRLDTTDFQCFRRMISRKSTSLKYFSTRVRQQVLQPNSTIRAVFDLGLPSLRTSLLSRATRFAARGANQGPSGIVGSEIALRPKCC
eukprot:Skav213176  [mRNA]  locus=scaffold11:190018:195933:- [translate_table: standard]